MAGVGDGGAELVGLVDERFEAIKRQHFPSYLELLKTWRENLQSSEEWMVKKEQEFTQYTDKVIAQYLKKGPTALHDHTYYAKDEECFSGDNVPQGRNELPQSSSMVVAHRDGHRRLRNWIDSMCLLKHLGVRIINRTSGYSTVTPHYCSEECWTMGFVVKSPSKYSSLSLPLLLGWQRMLLIRPALEGSRTDAYYSAPCGRRLRSMEEVHQFLETTSSTVSECTVSITNFTFDPFCSLICPPYNAKTAGAKVFIPDITCGTEAIPITCVNSLTSNPPEHFEYINLRIAGPGVHIETDPGFFVSCSCTDNCSNRAKCECWQLTMQEARMVGPTKHSVGYSHGRLKRPQHSAIYECNSLCSCGPKCGNRIVQRGVEHHLQVFRTEDRGWGLRTLRDIPAGSFICTYVGQIFPEHTLESQGGGQPTPISDEYFAELDYIEVMEHHKEGYESEVEFPTDHHSSGTSSTSSSGDESYHIDSVTSSNLKAESAQEMVSIPASDDDSSSTVSIISLSSSAGSSPPSLPHFTIPTSHPHSLPIVTPITTPPSPTHHSQTQTSSLSTFTSHHVTSLTQTTPLISPTALPPMEHMQYANRLSHLASDTTPPLISPTTGHLQSSGGPSHLTSDVTSSSNRPSFHTPITPSSIPLSHSQTEQQHRIISPHGNYLIPISPRKLHGMRTRQHFSEEFSYIIDAKDKGNIGRYINHSCSPNMFVQNVFVDTHDLRFPWVAFFAKTRIKTLQELTWDYSYEVGSVEGKVIYCHCKALNCRGRLI